MEGGPEPASLNDKQRQVIKDKFSAVNAAVEEAARTQVGRCRLTLSKPKLKAPGTERLKLEYDEPLSSFAFTFNLRRYTQAAWSVPDPHLRARLVAGQCRLTLSNPR
jgi:hypothetical protein